MENENNTLNINWLIYYSAYLSLKMIFYLSWLFKTNCKLFVLLDNLHYFLGSYAFKTTRFVSKTNWAMVARQTFSRQTINFNKVLWVRVSKGSLFVGQSFKIKDILNCINLIYSDSFQFTKMLGIWLFGITFYFSERNG